MECLELSQRAILQAFEDGRELYQPCVDGVCLLLENGDTSASLSNLRKLQKSERKLDEVFMRGPHRALFVFTNAEMYLALGFEIGRPSVKTKAFAEVLRDFGRPGYYRHLRSLPAEFKGAILEGYEPV